MNCSDSVVLSARAAEAFSTTTSEERRKSLLLELRPILHKLAKHIAGSEFHADDLVQDVCLTCLNGKYDPSRGSILAFAYRVMLNCWKDENQPRRRSVGGEGMCPDRAIFDNNHTAAEQCLDVTTPFGLDDCAIISRWSTRDRVILLCRGLLWRKVPDCLWTKTLASLGLPTEFPGPDFVDLSEPERNATLATALDIPVNTLCKVWERGWERVQTLRYVRELVVR